VVLQPERLRQEQALAQLAACAPDVIVTAAYGQILPMKALVLARLGAYNVHASLLPKYRGGAPIQWAIRHGETVTGVSLMTMVKEMDAGPVWATAQVPIAPQATYGEVHDLLAIAGAQLTVEALPKVLAGELQAQAQDLSRVTFSPPIRREDERIDFALGVNEVVNHIRSLAPRPGAYTTLAGQVLKLYAGRAQGVPSLERDVVVPGQVLEVTEEGLLVRCGDGANVILTQVQLAGRAVQSASEFARGRGTLVGACLGQLADVRS